MSKIDNLTRLRHMRDAAVEALDFVSGHKRNNLDSGRMLVLALVKILKLSVRQLLIFHKIVEADTLNFLGLTSSVCVTVLFMLTLK